MACSQFACYLIFFLLITKKNQKNTLNNNVQHNLIMRWEYACAERSLPPSNCVFNQWTGTFIYNTLQLTQLQL